MPSKNTARATGGREGCIRRKGGKRRNLQRGKRELQEGFPRGNGAQKGRRKTQEEKGEGSTDDAGVTYKVIVTKLSPIPVWSSSEHGKRKLPHLRAGGCWAEGTRLKVPGGPSLPQSSPAQI